MDWKQALAARKKRNPIQHVWDINTPTGARGFIADLRMGEKKEPIKSVKLEDGRVFKVSELTDQDAILVANQCVDVMQKHKQVKTVEALPTK